jgi:hypothetical protein
MGYLGPCSSRSGSRYSMSRTCGPRDIISLVIPKLGITGHIGNQRDGHIEVKCKCVFSCEKKKCPGSNSNWKSNVEGRRLARQRGVDCKQAEGRGVSKSLRLNYG